MPWRRSTAWACASRLRHASGSLGSTGSLAASARSARERQVLERLRPAGEAALQLARRRRSRAPARAAARARAARPGGRRPSPASVERPRRSASRRPPAAAPAASEGSVQRSLLSQGVATDIAPAGRRRAGAGRAGQRAGASAASRVRTSAISSARTRISASPSRFWPPWPPSGSRQPHTKSLGLSSASGRGWVSSSAGAVGLERELAAQRAQHHLELDLLPVGAQLGLASGVLGAPAAVPQARITSNCWREVALHA